MEIISIKSILFRRRNRDQQFLTTTVKVCSMLASAVWSIFNPKKTVF